MSPSLRELVSRRNSAARRLQAAPSRAQSRTLPDIAKLEEHVRASEHGPPSSRSRGTVGEETRSSAPSGEVRVRMQVYVQAPRRRMHLLALALALESRVERQVLDLELPARLGASTLAEPLKKLRATVEVSGVEV